MNTNNETILARLAVGAEAVDDGLGAVIVATDLDAFRVYVTGGALPDGSSWRGFSDGADAYAYASRVAAELAAECLIVAPAPGQAIAPADPLVAELATVLRDVAALLPCAGRLHPKDLHALQDRVVAALAKVQP